jgi:hypothetical protein
MNDQQDVIPDKAAQEQFLEVKPVPPIKIETPATRRQAELAAQREARDLARKAAEAAPSSTPMPESKSAPQPEYRPSEEVKRTQKILEQIDLRKRVRSRLVAEKNSRAVEIEGELRQAMKDRDARLEAVEAKAREQLAAIAAAFDDLGRERRLELAGRESEIVKLDMALEQLSKQLAAEISKVTGDLGKEA